MMVSLRTQLEMDLEGHKADASQDTEAIKEAIENLKCFMDLGLSDAVYKLALQKCNMRVEDAIFLLTDEILVEDL